LLRDVFTIMFRVSTNSKEEQEMNLLFLSVLSETLMSSSIATTVIAELHQIILEIYDKLASPSITGNSSNPYRLDPYLSQLLDYTVICFKSLPNELIAPKVTQLTSQSTEYCVKSIYVGCHLIAAETLPLNVLSTYRTWFVSQTKSTEGIFHFISSFNINIANAISLFEALSKPLKSMKDNEKSKWILDSFDTITMCPNPAMCLRLLALSLLLWSKEETSALFVHQFKYQVYSSSQTASFDNLLSYLLPKVLEQSNFSGSVDRILARLNSLFTNPNAKSIQPTLLSIFLSLRHSTVKGVNFSLTLNNFKA
jgi:hypothetical protein